MTNTEKTLMDVKNHEAKWRKALFHFIYSNRYTPYQVDLYYYPDTREFYEFSNPGGNSWLNDDHITVYTVNNEFGEEWAPGNVRDTAYYYKYDGIDYIIDNLIDSLEIDIEMAEEED